MPMSSPKGISVKVLVGWLVVIPDSHVASGHYNNHYIVGYCFSVLTKGLSINYFHYLVLSLRQLLKTITKSMTSLKFTDI